MSSTKVPLLSSPPQLVRKVYFWESSNSSSILKMLNVFVIPDINKMMGNNHSPIVIGFIYLL